MTPLNNLQVRRFHGFHMRRQITAQWLGKRGSIWSVVTDEVMLWHKSYCDFLICIRQQKIDGPQMRYRPILGDLWRYMICGTDGVHGMPSIAEWCLLFEVLYLCNGIFWLGDLLSCAKLYVLIRISGRYFSSVAVLQKPINKTREKCSSLPRELVDVWWG